MSSPLTRDPAVLKNAFKKVFGAMQPPLKEETVSQKVRRMKPLLRAELKRGLTFEQLSAGLATDDFKVKITPGGLRRLMSERRKAGGALAAQARVDAANRSAPAPAA